jgi:hypothetical protein
MLQLNESTVAFVLPVSPHNAPFCWCQSSVATKVLRAGRARTVNERPGGMVDSCRSVLVVSRNHAVGKKPV